MERMVDETDHSFRHIFIIVRSPSSGKYPNTERRSLHSQDRPGVERVALTPTTDGKNRIPRGGRWGGQKPTPGEPAGDPPVRSNYLIMVGQNGLLPVLMATPRQLPARIASATPSWNPPSSVLNRDPTNAEFSRYALPDGVRLLKTSV